MMGRGVTRQFALRVGGALSALAWLMPVRALAETIRQRLPWGAGQSDRPDRVDDRPGYIFLQPSEAAFIEAARPG